MYTSRSTSVQPTGHRIISIFDVLLGHVLQFFKVSGNP